MFLYASVMIGVMLYSCIHSCIHLYSLTYMPYFYFSFLTVSSFELETTIDSIDRNLMIN